ncbi:hypothetical protein ACFFSA_29940 [Nonomuraea helvata]|uniref:Chlor_Arch_YYY domain-containing protein n=2 Tax=Nonomuraea helvata TaxID=37484 RepID=A0ABV5S6N2_9ACTN
MAVFFAYVAVGLTLPGVLVIRALYAGSRTLVEEIALGLALGYAMEILLYIGARAVGVPRLVVAGPLTVYVLFLAVPSLRRYWRSSRRLAAPWWWSWLLALLTVLLVAWSGIKFFGTHAVTWPDLGATGHDMPFHLALISELRHHMPPSVPMVAGEPLFYHWFVYAHLAAASHLTGVEPLILLFRLGMLPMLAALVVLAGLTGRRVTGSWYGAAITAVGTVSVGVTSLYLGANGRFTWGGLPDMAWTSPTQTLGALLFAPLVLILINLIGPRGYDPRAWGPALVLLMAITGAKATYLPLLLAGLTFVAIVQFVQRRRLSRNLVIAFAVTTACFLFAQVILFGLAKQGLVVDLFSFTRIAWGELTGVDPGGSVPGLAAVHLLSWAISWAGTFGLLVRPRQLARPAVALLLGIGMAGVGAALVLGHPGRSQLFFFWGACPYLTALSACGLLALLRRARVAPTTTALWAALGVLTAYLISFFCDVSIPLAPGQDGGVLYRPYWVLLAAIVLAGAVLTVLRGALTAATLLVVACTAIGLPAYWHARVLSALDAFGKDDVRPDVQPAAEPSIRIPQGGLTAARWLRAHSDPDDLVATNVHCRWGRESPCDSTSAWASALTERHMLVEGWAYTATNLTRWRPGLTQETLPFWDSRRLSLNDAAFRAPTERVMRLLGQDYGVRWLFAEESQGETSSAIGDFARLRFRSGDYAVYRLTGSPA